MIDPPIPSKEFETWQEIADYLHISVREAQYRAKDEGLPVHRGLGKKARVWALQSELDGWKETRSRAPVRPAPAEAGGGEPAPAAAAKLFSRRNVVTAALVSGAILAASRAISRWHAPEVATATIAGRELIARDTSGREVWRHVFSEDVYPVPYDPANLGNTHWIGDLDGDGHNEVLFVYHPFAQHGQGSSLYCFGRAGEIRWHYVPGHAVRDSTGIIPPSYHIYTILAIFDGERGRRSRVAISSGHTTDQPCQVAILDQSGQLTAEYWHPGHFFFLVESRSGFGGSPRMIAGGVNNGEHQATLVALDPFAMTGASTPAEMKDQKFRLLDMPEANEEAVVLFPRSCLSRNEPYTRVSMLLADPQTVRVEVIESQDPQSQRIIYYDLDPSLTPRRAFLSSQYREEHLRLELAGDLNHPVDVDEAGLMHGVRLRRRTV